MKKFMKSHVYKVLVCVSLVLILIAGLIVSATLTDNDRYLVRETEIQNDGYTLTGTLYIPKAALEKDENISSFLNGNNTNKAPAIITHGGGSANRYFQQAHIVELVKRGFVVFAIDAYTHGESDNYPEGWGVYSHVHDAVEYVHSLNFVDDAHVGYFGHSQGGSATMMALKVYAGYYTLEDILLNMLHDELGVTITPEQVAAQDPDAAAAALDDYNKGVYETRKAEIIDEYNDLRISFAVVEGMANGSAPPLTTTREFNSIEPLVVEVGGVPVIRDIQANIGNTIAISDESVGMNALGKLEISTTKELPSAPMTRALFGTGTETVQESVLYARKLSDNEEQLPSTVLGNFDENCFTDPDIVKAAEDKTLRVLVRYPGWHNTSHYSQEDISAIANFMCLATGFNNGFIAQTGGANAAAFDDTQTWKLTHAANTVAFLALMLLAVSLAAVLLSSKSFAPAVCEATEAQTSKKSPLAWIFALITVILPVGLITPLMNNNIIPASWFTKFDRIVPIAFWSLCCACILLALIIIKWFVFDKKNTELSFRQFYGLTGNFKSVITSVAGIFIVLGFVVVLINLYYATFNGANFMTAMPGLNIPFQLTPISTERFIDWFFYVLYFLPYWIIGSMLINSFRMKDMPEWLNTLILVVFNFVPIAAFVYTQYAGNIVNGGIATIMGLNWATIIQMQGLLIAIPISVVFSRLLYKRTGSSLPGALLSAMIFTLPFMANVIAYTFQSVPTY